MMRCGIHLLFEFAIQPLTIGVSDFVDVVDHLFIELVEGLAHFAQRLDGIRHFQCDGRHLAIDLAAVVEVLDLHSVGHRELKGFLVGVGRVQLLDHHQTVAEQVIRGAHDEFTVTAGVDQIALLGVGNVFLNRASCNLDLADVELNNRLDIENRALVFCDHIFNYITHEYLLVRVAVV